MLDDVDTGDLGNRGIGQDCQSVAAVNCNGVVKLVWKQSVAAVNATEW